MLKFSLKLSHMILEEGKVVSESGPNYEALSTHGLQRRRADKRMKKHECRLGDISANDLFIHRLDTVVQEKL